ncbi:MAG: response regulator [Phormidesmis sp. CAN_BIN36]|nr:response regulator [Phormidesmis sp. CAN_BIN36]
MRILLVEDDHLIANPLAKALGNQHYIVDLASGGLEGWELAESFSYDLILLDVLLPQLDGISFCQRLRSQGNQTPILLLTAQGTSTNKIKGLDAGADDYVSKPFDLQELLARIRALLRRGRSVLPPLLTWGNLHLDPSTCEVTCESQPLRLTPKEYSLLELLLRNPQRTYRLSALIDHLWSLETPPVEETIRSHVKGLRHKIRLAGVKGDPIETVYGIGYRLRKADEPILPDPNLSASQPFAAEASVDEIWRDIRDQLSQRATVIEQAGFALQTNQLNQDLRSLAGQNAHKLSGSLGTFGSGEGSRLAQKIEGLLESEVPSDQVQLFCELAKALRQELHLMNTMQPPALLADDADDCQHSFPSDDLDRATILEAHNNTEPFVVDRAQSIQNLESALEFAQRETRSFSLAILNLDGSQQKIDHQHTQINQVIERCEALLRAHFRADDVIDCWGDRTFAIGMRNTPRQVAIERLSAVLKALCDQATEIYPLNVSFSVGIAEYPQDGADLQTLLRSATNAVEQSEVEGRDWAWLP